MASHHSHAHAGDHDHTHVGKAHSHVTDSLAIESEQGRISLQIIATLVGGMLLISSFVARWVFDSDVYAYLAAVSAALLGAPLVWVAIKDLMEGHAHMNELVALAVIAAFANKAYQEAGLIAFLMIISVLIENRTALGAQASIESLIRITPTKARRLRRRAREQEREQQAASKKEEADPVLTKALKVKATSSEQAGVVESRGDSAKPRAAEGEVVEPYMEDQEDEIDASQLKQGDFVKVLPGDNIPADGIVHRGTSTVNQANITGESIPVDKEPGDDVFGGTINVTGMLVIKVTKAGENTTLGRVKELILQAESTRIPIMRMIDRYAGWYTPTILMLVAIVLFLSATRGVDDPWQRAIAMLVIACPCALILATPTAMVAALSSAARLGVLVKSVVDLEAARNLTAMVFDKTGTLTTGELEVSRLSPAEGVEPVELLRTAAAAEKNSRHPVARAVAKVAQKANLQLPEPEDFGEVSGRGVLAVIDGQEVMVGRGEWIVEQNPDLADDAKIYVDQVRTSPETEGISVLFVLKAKRILGWVGLADNTRPEAANAMDQLRERGLKRLIMVTGDRESVAKRVAAQMHTDYQAEVLPHQKLELVDELKDGGHMVAVVGDGVNDAPALAAGDISIAMGAAGSDVAIHSAKIALMNNNLNRIPFLINLSRQASWVIRQNLIFAALFIVVGESMAASGWITPIWAAVLHVLSGLVVIFNSARLVRAGEDLEHSEAQQREEQERKQRRRLSREAGDEDGATGGATPALA